jgi:hypothetical protein
VVQVCNGLLGNLQESVIKPSLEMKNPRVDNTCGEWYNNRKPCESPLYSTSSPVFVPIALSNGDSKDGIVRRED